MSSATETRPPWHRSTLGIALGGSLMMWAALPHPLLPQFLGWLGWIAPVPWLLLVRGEVLPGRRPYRALWLAGFAFWLAAVYWLILPHPATSLGWLALSAYLACYLPVFISLSRVAVHRIGVPLWLAAPVVWTGLELARAHLLTGFLMASLAHSQVHWTPIIQICDLVGEYGVDFLIMTVAASVTCLLLPPRQMWSVAPAVLLLSATLYYGHVRLDESQIHAADAATVRIALIQGNSLAEWKSDRSREHDIMNEYRRLSERAVATARERDGRSIDLVVWPETMFRTPLISFDPGYNLPADAPRTKEEIAGYGPQDLSSLTARLNTPVLVGIDRVHFRSAAEPGGDPPPARRYNSAVLVNRDGKIVDTYDKTHRVMFGEYIPFAEYFPFLYRLTPLTGGIDAGAEPVVFELNDRFYAPNICYETVIPHVIRRQASTLVDGSIPADVLINMTNDAWYWGSSELDQHLACGVFRAVETRRPLAIAANGGISAWIDHFGRVRAQSPRQKPDIILADVERSTMRSMYARYGDWLAGTCLACCLAIIVAGWYLRKRNRLHRPIKSNDAALAIKSEMVPGSGTSRTISMVRIICIGVWNSRSRVPSGLNSNPPLTPRRRSPADAKSVLENSEYDSPMNPAGAATSLRKTGDGPDISYASIPSSATYSMLLSSSIAKS
jgi:apolipoprotein N-acyltransferase